MKPQKTAWIIGASSGIGKSLALLLAEKHWQVAISSRNIDSLELISNKSLNIFPYALDLTDIASIEKARDNIIEQLGCIDTLFLNAGDYSPMPVDEFDKTVFEKLISINYLGVVNGLDSILPYMRSRGLGEIFITASLAGYRGLPQAAPYNASKAAVISLAESLHLELKQEGVSLRIINPGFVESPLTDKNEFEMPFLITPDKAAEYIYKELHKNNFEIYFPKRFAWIMKTLRILPYRIYFALTKSAIQKSPIKRKAKHSN